MSKLKSIVLIPYWIRDTLNRNNLNISDCLDMNILKSVMSVEDLAGFANAQQLLNTLTGCNNLAVYDLEREWYQTADEKATAFISKVINPTRFDTNTVESVRTRLFNPELRKPEYDSPFITYDLTPTALGVVINPGFFTTTPDYGLQFDLVKALLQALYECNIAPTEVSPSPLFKRYLDLLSERTM